MNAIPMLLTALLALPASGWSQHTAADAVVAVPASLVSRTPVAVGGDDDPDRGPMQRLDVYVDESLLERIFERFGFDESQQVIARSIWEPYFADAIAIDAQTKIEMDEEGWLEFARLSQESREAKLPYEEWPFDALSEAQHRFHVARARGLLKADERLAGFSRDLIALAADAQQAADMEELLLPMVRRRSYFRQYAGNEQLGDFNPFVDLEVTLADFLESPAMAELMIAPEVREKLGRIIVKYVRDFDRAIEGRLSQNRKRLPPGDRAVSYPGDEQYARLMQFRQRVREPILTAADAIERTLREHVDDHLTKGAAYAWRMFFRKRFCPDLYADRAVEVWHPWAMSTFEFDEAEHALIHRWHELYITQRDRQREEAFRHGLRVESEFGQPSGPHQVQHEYQSMLRALQRPAIAFHKRFYSILSPGERLQFDQGIERFRKQHANFNSGPPLHSSSGD
ncbi:MAG: hypothetical protein ACR2GY_00435 [Phycisphaerales bacterium]